MRGGVIWTPPENAFAHRLMVGGPGYLGYTDPNARASAAPVQTANGIQLGLVGGLAGFTDPGDGVTLYWSWLDLFGRSLDPVLAAALLFEVVERTAPGLSSDTSWVVGIANETSLAGATVDGAWGGMRYTGASRNARAGTVLNGTASGISEDATPTGNMRGAIVSIDRMGPTQYVPGIRVQGIDSGRAILTGDERNIAMSAALGTGPLYVFLSAYRTAATAGTETLVVDPYSYAAPGVAHAA